MNYSTMAAVVTASDTTGGGDIRLLLFYISLALGVSFICSILEAVVLSMPQTHVSLLQKDGKKTGAMWSHLKDDDSVRALTAILTLNTVAHTMGAAGVGSQVHGAKNNVFPASQRVSFPAKSVESWHSEAGR